MVVSFHLIILVFCKCARVITPSPTTADIIYKMLDASIDYTLTFALSLKGEERMRKYFPQGR
jgi:hypothetical protein